MIRAKVHDALVAMDCPPADFMVSRCASSGLPSVRHGWASGLDFVRQGKVKGRF